MTPLKLICPTCKSVLSKVRLCDNGAEYNCQKCGRWFTSRELARPGVPSNCSGLTSKESRLAAPPNLLGLTKISIVLALKSATLADTVKVLVPKALHGTGKAFLRSAEIIEILCKGALDGSCVELHRGMVFLHLRMDDLCESRAAIGISADGLEFDGSQERVYVVVLFLRPRREAGADVPSWARKKLCDEKAIYQLRRATDIEAVFRLLQTT